MNMKNKKSDFLTMDNIVLAVLVLFVLVVILFIFKNVIFTNFKSLTGISNDSINAAKGNICRTFFWSERVCSSTNPEDTESYRYEEVYGDFTDCKKEEKCYERVRKEG